MRSCGLALEMDEDILKTRRMFADSDVVTIVIGRERAFERLAIATADMQTRTEECDVLDARYCV